MISGLISDSLLKVGMQYYSEDLLSVRLYYQVSSYQNEAVLSRVVDQSEAVLSLGFILPIVEFGLDSSSVHNVVRTAFSLYLYILR